MDFYRYLIIIISAINLFSCNNRKVPIDFLYKNDCENSYENFRKWQANNFYHLLNKYGIRMVNFDAETIYELHDLGNVISEILDSTHLIKYQLINEYHDSVSNKYKATYLIEDKEYSFETSSIGDYIDFDKNFDLLNEIASNTKSNCIFEIPWFPGDQSMSIVFAPMDTLEKAINEGFPLTISGKEWKWNNNNEWKNIKSIQTQINKPLTREKFRQQMVQTTNELIKSGIKIRPITLDRIYITCLYESNRVHVIVDGNDFLHSSCEISKNSVESNAEFWNVIFQYMLSLEYGNKKVDLIYEDGSTKTISSDTLKQIITKAQQDV